MSLLKKAGGAIKKAGGKISSTGKKTGIPSAGDDVVKLGKKAGGVVGGKTIEDRAKGAVRGAATGAVAGGASGGVYGAVAGGVIGGATGAAVGDENVKKVTGGVASAMGLGGGGKFNPDKYKIKESPFTGNKRSQKQKKSFGKGLKEAAGRQELRVDPSQIQTTNIDTMPQDQFRSGQAGLAAALGAQAAGVGPSLAGRQLQRGTEQTVSNAMALAASQRGRSAGQGLRQIQQAAAGASQQQAAQAADLAMQEQMAARQQLAGVLSGARTQDIGLATSQAGLSQAERIRQAELGQQAAQANQAANLQQQQISDDMTKFYQTGITGLDTRDIAGKQTLEQLKLGQQQGINQLEAQKYGADQQRQAGIMQGVGQLGMAAAMMYSDKKLKKDVAPGDAKVEGFLDALKAYEYKYKNPEMGEGTHVSPMAQDLEKTELGRTMVEDTPDGKMVDYGKAGGVMMSALAMQNEKMQDLEAKLAEVLKKRSKK